MHTLGDYSRSLGAWFIFADSAAGSGVSESRYVFVCIFFLALINFFLYLKKWSAL